MNQQNSRHSGRRSGRGPRRNSSNPRNESRQSPPPPAAKPSLWQRVKSLFTGGAKKSSSNGSASAPRGRQENRGNGRSESRQSRPPETVEVTTPKLYVGNLSFDAAESDLAELFNGVGAVRSAEIVTNKYNEKSKGFGFVTMASVDEAKRAVVELHDKDFMGRKLVVSGAKTSDREPDYRG